MSRDKLKWNGLVFPDQESPTHTHAHVHSVPWRNFTPGVERVWSWQMIIAPFRPGGPDTAVQGEKWAGDALLAKITKLSTRKMGKMGHCSVTAGNILGPGQYLIKHSWQWEQWTEQSTRQTFNQEDCALPLSLPPGALCQFDVWEKSRPERQLWTHITCS